MRSLYKLSIKAFLARCLEETAWQDLCKGSLIARSLNKISTRGLLARSLYKLPPGGPFGKILYEMSRFARACAVEIHMNISQEPFCVEN